jgi:signal peptidase II
MRRPAIFGLIVLLGVSIDLLSKWLIFRKLALGESYPLWPGVFHITTAENRGVAFSMLRDHPWIIFFVSFVAITALLAIFWNLHKRAGKLALAALCLLLIGAIGNLVDRLTFNHVRDFIDFVPELPLIGHWAVFNIADICITVGVGLYLVSEIWFKEPPSPAQSPN